MHPMTSSDTARHSTDSHSRSGPRAGGVIILTIGPVQAGAHAHSASRLLTCGTSCNGAHERLYRAPSQHVAHVSSLY